MAGVSSADITSSLNEALSAISGSKVDLSLSINVPFVEQGRQMEENQEMINKMAKIKKAEAERDRLNAENVRVGLNLRSPFQNRISGRS